MLRYPEPIEQTRYRDRTQPRITHVVMRLDDGRTVSFYEVALNGCISVYDSRRAALDACRNWR